MSRGRTPFTESKRSPLRMPQRAAGDPGTTFSTKMPLFLHLFIIIAPLLTSIYRYILTLSLSLSTDN
jgi:hypothetical protein